MTYHEICPRCQGFVWHRDTPCPCPCQSVAPQPFRAVTFRREYPQHEVAEHEVLLAFLKDSDAILFHEWWHHSGAVAFQQYLDAVAQQGR